MNKGHIAFGVLTNVSFSANAQKYKFCWRISCDSDIVFIVCSPRLKRHLDRRGVPWPLMENGWWEKPRNLFLRETHMSLDSLDYHLIIYDASVFDWVLDLRDVILPIGARIRSYGKQSMPWRHIVSHVNCHVLSQSRTKQSILRH